MAAQFFQEATWMLGLTMALKQYEIMRSIVVRI